MQGNRAIAEIQFADYIFPAFDQACLWFHSLLSYHWRFFFAILDCYCYFQILALLDLMIVYLYIRKCLISCSKQLVQSFISTLLFILTTFDSIFISGSIFFLFQAIVEPIFFSQSDHSSAQVFARLDFNTVVYLTLFISNINYCQIQCICLFNLYFVPT